MTADEIRSKYMNFEDVREPISFEFDGDNFRLRVPSVREWSEFFNKVYQNRSGKDEDEKEQAKIYIDIAHKKYACLQLLIDDERKPIFDAKTAKAIFDAPIGSKLDRLAAKASEIVEERVNGKAVKNSEEPSGTTPDSSSPAS